MTYGLWSRAAIGSMAMLLASCGGPDNVAPRFDVSAEFAKVTAARARLAAARERLDRTQARSSSTGAVPQSVENESREARSGFDDAYAQNQRALARFLSVALNEAPGRAETKQALDFFAADAVANARFAIDHGADVGRILEALTRAERAYRALGLGVPRDLSAVLEEVRRTAPLRPIRAASPTPAGSGHSRGRSTRGRYDRV